MKLIQYAYPQSPSANAINRLCDLGAPSIERFGSLFDDIFAGVSASQQAAVNLYEDTENYYVRAELPGVSKEDIEIELENSVLTIRKKKAEKDRNVDQLTSDFTRSITVPEGVVVDSVSASSEAGVLTVTLPKEPVRQPRSIQIK